MSVSITSVDFYLQRTSSAEPYADVQVLVYDGDSQLVGSSAAISAGGISTSAEWVTFTFTSPILIENAGNYSFVIRKVLGSGTYTYVGVYKHYWPHDYTCPTWDRLNYDGSVSGTETHIMLRINFDSGEQWPGEAQTPYEVAINLQSYYLSGELYVDPALYEAPPSTPTLSSPANEATDLYLNTDGLFTLSWEDADALDISAYTVWFNGVEQTDRSKYFTGSYHMYIADQLDYDTSYSWFVRKTVDSVDYDSDTWSLTTTTFKPPAVSTKDDGGGGGGALPTGENNLMTIKRLVVAARNKIFYEDV